MFENHSKFWIPWFLFARKLLSQNHAYSATEKLFQRLTPRFSEQAKII